MKEKKIEQFLKEKYNQTKWPFFSFIQIKNQFGENSITELKQLKNEKKVRLRGYINGYLIELIDLNFWLE